MAATSGTRRIDTTAVVDDAQFPPEEPTSFDTRRTPVVPAEWPQEDSNGRPTQRAPDDPSASTDAHPAAEVSPASPAPSTVQTVAVSAPTVALSAPTVASTVQSSSALESIGPPSGEASFFDTAPQYSLPPPDLFFEAPRAKPSLWRVVTARLLFSMIVCLAVTLLAYEISVAFQLPLLDPRRLLDVRRLV